jgi:hypothetical protein
VDVDNDGDVDFISGRAFGSVYWFEQQARPTDGCGISSATTPAD